MRVSCEGYDTHVSSRKCGVASGSASGSYLVVVG